MRQLVATYSGPIINVRRSSDNVTADFYTDAKQTYLTTGINGTGTTYASWIGANTGYITKWYDQSGKGNHATNSTTGTTQPNITKVASPGGTNYYVVQWQNANSTVLNSTNPFSPNTIFSQFYENISSSDFGTLIGTPYGGFISNIYRQVALRLYTNSYLGSNYADWFFSNSGTKIAYQNGSNVSSNPTCILYCNTTYDASKWNRLSLSASTTDPNVSSWGGMTVIGADPSSNVRSINGYMTDLLCHNTPMTATDMQQYYANVLF